MEEHFKHDFEDIPDNIRVCIICLEFITDFKRVTKMCCSNKCNRKYLYQNQTPEEKKFIIDRQWMWEQLRNWKKKLELGEINEKRYIKETNRIKKNFYKKYGERATKKKKREKYIQRLP